MACSPRRWRALAGGLLGVAAAVLLATPARAADPWRYLPKDTKVVVTVNLKALPESDQKAWRKLGEQLYAVHLTPELKGNKPAIRDVTSLTFALPFAGSPGGMILIRGKVDRKLLAQQGRKSARSSRGKVVEIKPTRAQPVPIFRRRLSEKGPLLPLPDRLSSGLNTVVAESEVYFAAVDEETLILTVSPAPGLLSLLQPPGHTEIVKAAKARPKATKPRASADLLALLRKQDSRAWLWCVIMDNALDPRLALLMPDLNDTCQKWEHVVGEMREGKDVEMRLVATGKDVEAAKELEKNARDNALKMRVLMPTLSTDARQKAVLKELAESFQVSRTDTVVTVTGKIAATKIRLLFARPPAKKD